MIKKVIAAAFVTVVASQADAVPFNGFNIGFNGGVLMAHNEISHTSNLPQIKKANKTLGLFGVQFGYEMSRANSLYSRVGILVSFPTGKANSSTRVFGQQDIHFTAKNGPMTEFQAAMGYNFCNDVAAYGLVGLSVSKKTYTLEQGSRTILANGKKSVKETKAAPVVGFGAMKKIDRNLTVGAEYKHTFEQDKKLINAKFKSDSDTVLARVSYHF